LAAGKQLAQTVYRPRIQPVQLRDVLNEDQI
jgi:hypothetical protein